MKPVRWIIALALLFGCPPADRPAEVVPAAPQSGRDAPDVPTEAPPERSPAGTPDPAAAETTTRPDVIVIVIDTLRADHLGAYGYRRDTSPHIDRLAGRAVRFARCLSQAPWTTPSMASMLTSLYPSRIGITDVPDALPDGLETLPEILGGHGYATAAVISHDFLGSRWNFDQGFEIFHESLARGHRAISAPGVTEAALEILADGDERPLFLFLHYFDPHGHYLRHEGFEFGDGSSYDGRLLQQASPRVLKTLLPDRIRDADIAYAIDLYDSEIAFTDHHLGRLLDALEQGGRFDETLILLTADHGEEFHDHGDFGHTNTLYGEVIDVPLLIKLPGQREGRLEKRTVGLVDVLPTVLEVVGLPADDGLDGVSLLRAPPADRLLFSETSRVRELRAVVRDRFKLIRNLRDDSVELFDLIADPRESRNLAGGAARSAESSLGRELESWIARTGGPPAASGPSVELTEEETERLRSLGYIE